MRLGSLRLSEEVTAVDALAEHERQVREARLDVARRQTNWQEIAATSLVARGRYLVEAESDTLFVHRRGHVFDPRSASIAYVTPDAPLAWFTDENGDVQFLEQPTGVPRTWSEIVAQKARRR